MEPDEDLSDCRSCDEETPVCVHKVANRNRYPKLTAKLDIHGRGGGTGTAGPAAAGPMLNSQK